MKKRKEQEPWLWEKEKRRGWSCPGCICIGSFTFLVVLLAHGGKQFCVSLLLSSLFILLVILFRYLEKEASWICWGCGKQWVALRNFHHQERNSWRRSRKNASWFAALFDCCMQIEIVAVIVLLSLLRLLLLLLLLLQTVFFFLPQRKAFKITIMQN